MIPPLSPPTGDLRRWADRATVILGQIIERHNRPYPQVVQLQRLTSAAKATQDGQMMWDATQGCPVFSKGGAWLRIDQL